MTPPWTEVYVVEPGASATHHLSLRRRVFVKVFRKLSKIRHTSTKTLTKTSIATATFVAASSISCNNNPSPDAKITPQVLISPQSDVSPVKIELFKEPRQDKLDQLSTHSSTTSHSHTTLYSIAEEKEDIECDVIVTETTVQSVDTLEEETKRVIIEELKQTEEPLQNLVIEKLVHKTHTSTPTPVLMFLGACTTLSMIVAARYTLFGR